MEITLDAIISLIGLFLGGGAFFTGICGRKAEAQQAEVDTAKDKQEYYQRMIDDVAKDRDYKQERDEVRERMDKMASLVYGLMEADKDRMDMKMEIARLGRKVELAPFMCGDLQCKLRA